MGGGGGGVTNFVLERACLEENQIWVNRGLLAKKATVAASPKILQLELWREMSSAKYGLNGPTCMKRIKSTDEVPQRTILHLHVASTISRALQLHDNRIWCLADRNREIFLPSRIDFLFIFGQCGVIVNKICFWKEK